MATRKAGRPLGARNKKRMPKTEEIVKLSKQNFELVLEQIYNILIDNPPEGVKHTEKQKDTAMRLAADLGKHFMSLEMSSRYADKTLPKEETKKEETTTADNVVSIALKPFTAAK